MVAVVVVMAIMAIALTVAVQTASFQRKRENEQELIFRGEQFVEAVRLFRARNGRFPLKLEELVKAKPHVLRQAWKDPITGKFDWVPVFFGQGGTQLGGGAANPTQTPSPFAAPTPQPTEAPEPAFGDEGDDTGERSGGRSGRRGGGRSGQGGSKEEAPFPPTDATGPIVGVHSRSKADAILVRNGRSRYCDWNFALDQNQQGGGQGQPQATPRR